MARIAEQLAAAAREAVKRLFLKQGLRLGVVKPPRGDKRLLLTVDPAYTLPGLYQAAAREQGVIPAPRALEEIRRVAAGYLNAQEAAAQAAVTRVVTQIVSQVEKKRLTPAVKREIAGALGRVFEKLSGAVERIADTEATAVRNLAGGEAVGAMAAAAGEEDPNVYFVVVRDSKLCKECRSLHLLGNKPRVWRRSECSRTYHRRGDDHPSELSEHPFCRCTMVYLARGFGFDDGGNLVWRGVGHDEWAAQRG